MFDAKASQGDIYRGLRDDMLKWLFDGFHGALIAMGQVGSGKTYTLLGPGPFPLPGSLNSIKLPLLLLFADGGGGGAIGRSRGPGPRETPSRRWRLC